MNRLIDSMYWSYGEQDWYDDAIRLFFKETKKRYPDCEFPIPSRYACYTTGGQDHVWILKGGFGNKNHRLARVNVLTQHVHLFGENH